MTSDGCSIPAVLKRHIPALQKFADACDGTACAVHDEAYERGGTEVDRVLADVNLMLAAIGIVDDKEAVEIFDFVRLYGRAHWGSARKWHGGDRAWPEPSEAP